MTKKEAEICLHHCYMNLDIAIEFLFAGTDEEDSEGCRILDPRFLELRDDINQVIHKIMILRQDLDREPIPLKPTLRAVE